MEYEETETDRFVNSVLKQLTIPNPGDRNAVWAQIAILYRQWYTADEVLAFCNCMEEVNPSIDKKIAQIRMNEIRQQAEARIQNENPIEENISLWKKYLKHLGKLFLQD